jgi:hypothetical protein
MRKQWAGLNSMEFSKGIRGYEACISQIRRQKSNLNDRPHILRGNSTVFKLFYKITYQIFGRISF